MTHQGSVMTMEKSQRAQKPLVYNAVILKRVDLTDRLSIFYIQPDPVKGIDAEFIPLVQEFKAGQYAMLGANNDKHPEKGAVRRAYSIASPPEERRWMEFYIRYVQHPASDNPLTHLLWEKKAGDRLWLGPRIAGHFTLEKTIGEDDRRLKVFVAAGTGLAPFVSIIRNCLLTAKSHVRDCLSRFVVLHGASQPHELGYREDLQRVLNNVQTRYFPTVSRPQHAPDWQGDLGRVETFFDAEKLDALEKRAGLEPGGLNPERAVVYVCGLQGTIANTLIHLLRRGFVPNDRKIRQALRLPMHLPSSLFFEQYDSNPIIDLKNEDFLQTLREAFPQGIPA